MTFDIKGLEQRYIKYKYRILILKSITSILPIMSYNNYKRKLIILQIKFDSLFGQSSGLGSMNSADEMARDNHN